MQETTPRAFDNKFLRRICGAVDDGETGERKMWSRGNCARDLTQIIKVERRCGRLSSESVCCERKRMHRIGRDGDE